MFFLLQNTRPHLINYGSICEISICGGHRGRKHVMQVICYLVGRETHVSTRTENIRVKEKLLWICRSRILLWTCSSKGETSLRCGSASQISMSCCRYRRERNHASRPNCFGERRLNSYESWTNTNFKALGYLDKGWRTSTTSTTTPRLCRSKKRMSGTLSEQTHASKSESAIRRKWRIWLRCWSENRIEMGQRAAGKPAAYFVFVVTSWQNSSWQNWNSWWWHSSKPNEGQWVTFFWHAVSDCPNVVPTIRRGVYTEYTPVACITNTAVFSQAQITYVLVAQVTRIAVSSWCAWKNPSSGRPCHLLAGPCLTFSLPVHHNTKHHLDSTTFSKTTLHTEHLFHNLYSRQSALMNRWRTSITRVAETRATPLPQKVALFVKSTFVVPSWTKNMSCKWFCFLVWRKQKFQQAPRTSVSKENYREFVYLSKSGPICEAWVSSWSLVKFCFWTSRWYSAELCGRTAKTANVGTFIRQVP